MRRVCNNKREDGGAIVELIMVIPIFIMLVCFIIEIGNSIIAHAAVDDAAYAVAHTYAADPSVRTTELIKTAAGGHFNENDLKVTISTDKTDSIDSFGDKRYVYTHHFPNDPNDTNRETHSMYYQDVTLTVTYTMYPRTFIGEAIAGGKGKGMEISASSEAIVDRTSSDQVHSGKGWWN